MAEVLQAPRTVSDDELYRVLGGREVADEIQANASRHAMADVFLASSVEADARTRQRLTRILGAVAVENSAEGSMSPEQALAEKASLVAVVEDYFSDDPERSANARARLRADLRTNVFEVLDALGHVSESHSKWQGDAFYQYGYNQTAMYAHGTFHAKGPIEHGRRRFETLNELRIVDGHDTGFFETHYLVEESRTPGTEGLSEDEIEGLKELYDLDKHKTMWRLTTVDEAGNRVTFIAAIRGIDKSGNRCDVQGVRYVREMLGASLGSDDPTAGLGGAFWVHKDLLPNGIADIAYLHDEGVGGNSFFGVEDQHGDYATIIEVSRQRERQAERDMDAKVHAMALEIRGMLRGDDCDEALWIMACHAKDFAAELCIADATYDAAQFGPAAATHIERARQLAAQGDVLASQQAMQAAKETAIVYMCGMRLEMEQARKGPGGGQTGDCEFVSKECPNCHKKNVKTTAKNGVYIGACGCRSDKSNLGLAA